MQGGSWGLWFVIVRAIFMGEGGGGIHPPLLFSAPALTLMTLTFTFFFIPQICPPPLILGRPGSYSHTKGGLALVLAPPPPHTHTQPQL